MIANQFLEIFERDILKVQEEIRAYKNESDMWKTSESFTNSAGTLCLHLTGNLNHFIGAVMGQTGYVRQRELEFSMRDQSRESLLDGLTNALKMVRETLPKLKDGDFEKDFPIDFLGQRKTLQVMIILIAHLNYHLGQINYHRRMLS
jgi:hypothetical protein